MMKFANISHKNIISLNKISKKYLSSNSNGRKISIGFCGLGNMGSSMARNILRASQTEGSLNGSHVMVYDIIPSNVEKLVADGAVEAKAVGDLATCSIIVTMVPATKHVTDLLLGSESSQKGLFNVAKKGTLFIDSSTIDPITSKALHQEANSRGLKFLDAPVSGGVTGAAAGTLTFMVGGDEDDLNLAKPVLTAMGKNIVHCGGPGTGGVTKLCNNLSLAISMIGTSEALNLGVKLGMDPVKLSQVMNTSTARCWSSDSYNPVPGVMPNVPASRGYSGGFGSALMEKDLTLAMNASSSVKARLPLGASAHQLYGLLCEHGYGNKDFSSIYEYLSSSTTKTH